jgi:endogenous inhibitor of DNA gyrase (YacG/DUF329 family)
MASSDKQPDKLGSCPICGKPAAQRYRPFCSPRCADADLQRWFTGRYAIPAVEDEDAPQEPSQVPPEDAGQPRRG